MVDIKACLFDLDGVIVDTAKYHYLAWKRLCNELGFDLTVEENESLKGISRVESLNILLRKGNVTISPEEREELLIRKNDWYLGYVNTMKADEILPGVLHFLKAVRASGRQTALGSASKNAMHILETLDIVPLFEAVIDGTKVTRGKPDPQTFLLGADALGVEPSKCVVFEDAAAGVDAAIAGGMYAVGVGAPEVLHRAHRVIPGFDGMGLEFFDEI